MLVNRSTNTSEVRQENLLRLLLCRKAAELSPFSIGILFELAFCEIQHVRVRRTARLAARRSEWQAPCIAGAAMALAAFARLVLTEPLLPLLQGFFPLLSLNADFVSVFALWSRPAAW